MIVVRERLYTHPVPWLKLGFTLERKKERKDLHPTSEKRIIGPTKEEIKPFLNIIFNFLNTTGTLRRRMKR
jgi:hypothetical protein